VRGLARVVPEPWRTRYEQEIHEALILSDNAFRDTLDLIVWGVRLRMERRARFSVMVGFLLVLPFMILEWSTRSEQPRSDFSVLLFILMWLAAAVFLFVLTPMVQAIRTGNFAVANPISTVLKVALLVVIAWSWVGLVIDQMPCFLGATGC
jgi:hypothetical protein